MFEYVDITQYLADLFPNKGTRDASCLSEGRIVTEVSKDSCSGSEALSLGAMPFADA